MARIAIVYATKHNHTKKVVDSIVVEFKYDLYNVCDLGSLLGIYDLVIFFCPTYGDEELPLDMEDFLVKLTIRNKLFVICELGNYYGYDNYEFGALKIIKSHLIDLDWREFMGGLSLDSLPKIDWEQFYIWCKKLNRLVNL